MNHDAYTDAYLRDVLGDVRSIAIVGLSASWNRPSYFVAKYLQAKGYRVLPVNPREAGGEILGMPVAGSIGDLGETPDLVDVFRNSAAAGPITDEAIAAGAKAVWMQIGVRNDEAAFARRSGRPARRDEPLPEDRIFAPVRRIELGRLLFGRHHGQAPAREAELKMAGRRTGR